jgi:hypothetical protein
MTTILRSRASARSAGGFTGAVLSGGFVPAFIEAMFIKSASNRQLTTNLLKSYYP